MARPCLVFICERRPTVLDGQCGQALQRLRDHEARLLFVTPLSSIAATAVVSTYFSRSLHFIIDTASTGAAAPVTTLGYPPLCEAATRATAPRTMAARLPQADRDERATVGAPRASRPMLATADATTTTTTTAAAAATIATNAAVAADAECARKRLRCRASAGVSQKRRLGGAGERLRDGKETLCLSRRQQLAAGRWSSSGCSGERRPLAAA